MDAHATLTTITDRVVRAVMPVVPVERDWLAIVLLYTPFVAPPRGAVVEAVQD